ncbi:hydroxymethylpyrimidine phosphate kinase ThiD [Geminocystis sp. NIES-3708]|uniref:bifunctional hydroxymethylpyrimidine kinase/phosphomethylpyrimidine kinase n=1 Tax=Geminocystis sp. NIES-3708 TaxID=1615909 RepID=UPI0005FCC17B|nr:bifunctional hydroxymethylpyrimidine kinase/phosphomethylpyrimidine kinase [Geminocystis sp. NIES-3708]BAQ59830.1 hydroxymethylpyrimidine phosphate kinase ThiD [Geminocystis sp. NIES-3708]
MIKIPSTLTIAGSDSGGGAGIQADLKTFAFHRVHGSSVITCVTAQNTVTVTDVLPIPPLIVKSQLEAVFNDLEIKSLKTGMLLNQEIMTTVAHFLTQISLENIVIDPVMVSRTGSLLIDNQAITTLTKLLIPKALIVTPNIYEAQLLSDVEIFDIKDMEKSAQKIYELGAKNILIKGGAREGKNKGIDLFYDGKKSQILQIKTINTKNTHGTGCTLAAAITANLALGKPLFTAVAQGKEYVTNALEYGLDIGAGAGPVAHFYSLL